MAIKLIATDMDGTLLDNERRLPIDFQQWVLNHPNITTVIASGRQYYTLKADFPKCAHKLIFLAENGSIAFHNNKKLFSDPLSKEEIHTLLKIPQRFPLLTPILCGANAAYMPDVESRVKVEASFYYISLRYSDNLVKAADNDEIVKVAFFVEDSQAEDVYKEFPKLDKGLCKQLSGKDWIDVQHITSNKGIALKKIQKLFNISSAECMAFGDYLNDSSLLAACEESYCMKNGHPDLKAAAKHIAPSNDNDGVMKVLRTL